jgi:hypothetical protein
LRERPKSREETPKEGDGNERGLSRYRTATTYTASHKTQVLLTYFSCIFPQNLLHFVQGRSSTHQSSFPAAPGFKVNARNIIWLIDSNAAIVQLRKIEARRLQIVSGYHLERDLADKCVLPATPKTVLECALEGALGCPMNRCSRQVEIRREHLVTAGVARLRTSACLPSSCYTAAFSSS